MQIANVGNRATVGIDIDALCIAVARVSGCFPALNCQLCVFRKGVAKKMVDQSRQLGAKGRRRGERGER